MNHKFKTIILFSSKSEKTLQYKTCLETIKYVKIFETSVIDEVQQIIDMSDKAVIIVDNEVQANKIFKGTFNKKKARFKKFYLNWYLTVSQSLKDTYLDQAYTVIDSDDVDSVIERVELYLFGKVHFFSNRDYKDDEEAEKNFKKGYFTHLEKIDGRWKVMTSSHEADDEVSDMLGKNWDLYLGHVLAEASDMKVMFETDLHSARFHELVYPHIVDGKVRKLSIVHISIDENFSKNIIRIHDFLQTL